MKTLILTIKRAYPILVLGLGITLGVVMRPLPWAEQASAMPIQIRRTGWQLTSPLLECAASAAAQAGSEAPEIALALREAHDANVGPGLASALSVYFQDLSSGEMAALNADVPYAPASMLKVPVLISLLREAQYDPLRLAATRPYFGPTHTPWRQNIAPGDALQPGRTYSLDTLLEHAIVHSDNEAMALVHTVISQSSVNQTYRELNLPETGPDLPNDFMSTRQYATFFRVLFNATYLNPSMSEKALNLLALAAFKDGLVAGVPPGTIVAHKFGERGSLPGEPVSHQLHDCGIVYYTRHPYLLCVMTRGGGLPQLQNVIADVSRRVFLQMEARVGGHI